MLHVQVLLLLSGRHFDDSSWCAVQSSGHGNLSEVQILGTPPGLVELETVMCGRVAGFFKQALGGSGARSSLIITVPENERQLILYCI